MKAKDNIKQQTLREEFIEHYLTYDPQANRLFDFGSMELSTPSKELLDKEGGYYNPEDPCHDDALLCVCIITILLLAKEASVHGQISRRNAVAAHRVLAAYLYFCEGRTLDAIGKPMGKNRDVIGNHKDRFVTWCETNGTGVKRKVTPEHLETLVLQFKRPVHSLEHTFDELRISLFSLMHKLMDASKEGNAEVFRHPEKATDCKFTANVIKAFSL